VKETLINEPFVFAEPGADGVNETLPTTSVISEVRVNEPSETPVVLFITGCETKPNDDIYLLYILK
jgi:hypothetical protein